MTAWQPHSIHLHSMGTYFSSSLQTNVQPVLLSCSSREGAQESNSPAHKRCRKSQNFSPAAPLPSAPNWCAAFGLKKSFRQWALNQTNPKPHTIEKATTYVLTSTKTSIIQTLKTLVEAELSGTLGNLIVHTRVKIYRSQFI
jgi:hypothetical protein